MGACQKTGQARPGDEPTVNRCQILASRVGRLLVSCLDLGDLLNQLFQHCLFQLRFGEELF